MRLRFAFKDVKQLPIVSEWRFLYIKVVSEVRLRGSRTLKRRSGCQQHLVANTARSELKANEECYEVLQTRITVGILF